MVSIGITPVGAPVGPENLLASRAPLNILYFGSKVQLMLVTTKTMMMIQARARFFDSGRSLKGFGQRKKTSIDF